MTSSGRRVVRLFQPLVRQAFSPRYLVGTNAVLGMTFMTAADTIQQKLEHYLANDMKQPLDTNRTSKCVCVVCGRLYVQQP